MIIRTLAAAAAAGAAAHGDTREVWLYWYEVKLPAVLHTVHMGPSQTAQETAHGGKRLKWLRGWTGLFILIHFLFVCWSG